MLKKHHRLTVAAFDAHFKSGKRRHGTYLQLIHSPAPVFHGAVVVGKKVYKTAVGRNRLRRQLYAVLFEYKQQKNNPGVYIALVKPAARLVPVSEVRAELRTLLAQCTQSR